MRIHDIDFAFSVTVDAEAVHAVVEKHHVAPARSSVSWRKVFGEEVVQRGLDQILVLLESRQLVTGLLFAPLVLVEALDHVELEAGGLALRQILKVRHCVERLEVVFPRRIFVRNQVSDSLQRLRQVLKHLPVHRLDSAVRTAPINVLDFIDSFGVHVAQAHRNDPAIFLS